MPGFENLHPLLNLDFQNLRKKQKASIDLWPQFHKLKLRRTLRSYLLGSALPQTLLYTLPVILGCAVFVYIAPRRSYSNDKEVQ